MSEAIIMLGLPGSGKSTYIADYINLVNYNLVSADEIRLNHPDYDPSKPDAIHELCVNIAEQNVYALMNAHQNIVMDGGGINNNYTARIIKKLKENNYYIKVIFINTPVRVCLQRNQTRIENKERFVPTANIIDKFYKLKKTVKKLTDLSDEFIEIKYFTDKHIFIDMDGVVAEYQDLIVDENKNINFVSYEVFKYAKPVMDVINRLEKLSKTKELYILSAAPNSICIKEKIEWLKVYLPFIKSENIYFVGNKDYKTVMLDQLIKLLKLEYKDCMVIEDEHNIIQKACELNVHAIHPSKFLTDY